MILKPKVRGFVCVTAHPTGCAAHLQQQIDHIKAKGPIKQGPKRVLVIGASTGYGLASRITAAFGSGAATLGIFFERPSEEGRPATPGWYNSIAFTRAAKHLSLNPLQITEIYCSCWRSAKTGFRDQRKLGSRGRGVLRLVRLAAAPVGVGGGGGEGLVFA